MSNLSHLCSCEMVGFREGKEGVNGGRKVEGQVGRNRVRWEGMEVCEGPNVVNCELFSSYLAHTFP